MRLRRAADDPSVESPVRPGDALRPGRADAIIILVLWTFRRLFWPLLIAGVSVAIALGQFEEGALDSLTSPWELFGALLSPLAGVALAMLLRIAVGWLALAAAWPLSR